MFTRCFYIFNRINYGTVIKLLAVGKEADFIHLINNCRHKFVKSRETSLTKKSFFHYSRIQKKAVKKRSRQGCPTEREAYKLEGFPGTEALKVALEPGG